MGIRCTLVARSSTDGTERRLRLDKAWDALEVLLTGGRGVAGQIGDAVTGRGGKKCAPQGAFGPARRLDRQRVAQIAEALAAIDEATVRSRYDRLAALEVHGGYGKGHGAADPAIEAMLREEGFYDEVEPEDLAELLGCVERLTAFYAAARERGDEVVVALG